MLLIGMLVTLGAVNPPRFMQYLIVFTGGGLSVSFLVPVTLAMYWPRDNCGGGSRFNALRFFDLFEPLCVGYLIYGSPTPLTLLELDPLIWGFAASLLAGVTGSLLSKQPSTSKLF